MLLSASLVKEMPWGRPSNNRYAYDYFPRVNSILRIPLYRARHSSWNKEKKQTNTLTPRHRTHTLIAQSIWCRVIRAHRKRSGEEPWWRDTHRYSALSHRNMESWATAGIWCIKRCSQALVTPEAPGVTAESAAETLFTHDSFIIKIIQ